MTEETPKGEFDASKNEAIVKAVEGAELVREKSLPVYMRRHGTPVMIGSSVVTRKGDVTEIAMKLDTAEGLEMGLLLTSGIAQGLTLGGAIDPNLIAKLS